jgi:hypothetical protein
MFVLNKENRGYLTPIQFNAYAKLAQQTVFDNMFVKYRNDGVKKNNRIHALEFGDEKKKIKEDIERFMKEEQLFELDGYFLMPEDCYYTLQLIWNDSIEIEEAEKNKMLTYLQNSTLAAPSRCYPVYSKYYDKYLVKPDTIIDCVTAVYVRKLKDPKWTYQTIQRNPVFNPSDISYQDFELQEDYANDIIAEILKLAGLQLQDQQVLQASLAYEQNTMAKEK